ncbi:MAG TPA: GNAT family N-acetyltransferase [Xanthobacteraceae bacterium]|jgi:predicted GNAT family acetyltransferase|nr:GNAT family N-acetyltransferase [Xanthobacteraceae bacterium]
MSDVVDNPEKHRYEISVDGLTAFTTYRIADGVITFIHTEVPPEFRGKGIGSKLVRGELEAARARGLKVVPRCEFVAGYIDKHPEFRDLLAAK